MRRLVLVLSILTVALIAVVSPVMAQSTSGYRLPRDHQYERYDGATGTYTRVDVNQVPGLIGQKVWIYDRTAQTWVYKAPEGLNASYGAPAAGGVVSGGLSLPPNHQYERYDGASGTYTRVDVHQVPGLVDKKIWVYDRTAQVWVYKAPQGVDPRYSGNVAGGAAAPATQGKDNWQRIHGVVQNVQGSTVHFRADDGRVLTVDASKVGANIRSALTAGEGVTVIGYDWTGPNALRAEYIQQDSSKGVRQPSASPR